MATSETKASVPNTLVHQMRAKAFEGTRFRCTHLRCKWRADAGSAENVNDEIPAEDREVSGDMKLVQGSKSRQRGVWQKSWWKRLWNCLVEVFGDVFF